jgi:hypothetical protein
MRVEEPADRHTEWHKFSAYFAFCDHTLFFSSWPSS